MNWSTVLNMTKEHDYKNFNTSDASVKVKSTDSMFVFNSSIRASNAASNSSLVVNPLSINIDLSSPTEQLNLSNSAIICGVDISLKFNN